MMFWVVFILLLIITIVMFYWACKSRKGSEIFVAATFVFGITMVAFFGSLPARYNENYITMANGQKFATAILDEKRLEAKLVGNFVEVSSSKFSVASVLDMELRDRIIRQAEYVDYNTWANANWWYDIYHPNPKKPLLKIVIVK